MVLLRGLLFRVVVLKHVFIEQILCKAFNKASIFYWVDTTVLEESLFNSTG